MDHPTPRLALLEVREADGRLVQVHHVHHWPVRVGRALDNDVVLTDVHAAAHHASLDLGDDGRPRLRVGDTRNGVRLDGPRGGRSLAAGDEAPLSPMARWHVGHNTLQLRLPTDPLPAERVMLALRTPPSQATVFGLIAVALAWQLGNVWLNANPTTPWESYLRPLLASVSTLVLWVGLWSLVSKLFVHRVNLFTHLRIALGWTLAGAVLEALLGLLAYAFDAPMLSRLREPLGMLMLAGMVGHHLRVVLPAHPRLTGTLVGSIAVLAIAGQTVLQLQHNGRPFRELYLATLAPPALRVVGGESASALVESLRPLEQPLLERAREAAQQDAEP